MSFVCRFRFKEGICLFVYFLSVKSLVITWYVYYLAFSIFLCEGDPIAGPAAGDRCFWWGCDPVVVYLCFCIIFLSIFYHFYVRLCCVITFNFLSYFLVSCVIISILTGRLGCKYCLFLSKINLYLFKFLTFCPHYMKFLIS